jgi:hypothetical protein
MKNSGIPILCYLLIVIISFACAITFFKFGGSLAEVTGNENNLLGLSFKASGAIGGFIIIFWLSQIVILRFFKYFHKYGTINIKVYLSAGQNGFDRQDDTYEAECIVFNEDSGESKTHSTKPFWEAGYLTVMARDLGEKDFLSVKIKNSRNKLWVSDTFHSRSPKIIELNQLN